MAYLKQLKHNSMLFYEANPTKLILINLDNFCHDLKSVHYPIQMILLSCSLIKVRLNWIASNELDALKHTRVLKSDNESTGPTEEV